MKAQVPSFQAERETAPPVALRPTEAPRHAFLFCPIPLTYLRDRTERTFDTDL